MHQTHPSNYEAIDVKIVASMTAEKVAVVRVAAYGHAETAAEAMEMLETGRYTGVDGLLVLGPNWGHIDGYTPGADPHPAFVMAVQMIRKGELWPYSGQTIRLVRPMATDVGAEVKFGHETAGETVVRECGHETALRVRLCKPTDDLRLRPRIVVEALGKDGAQTIMSGSFDALRAAKGTPLGEVLTALMAREAEDISLELSLAPLDPPPAEDEPATLHRELQHLINRYSAESGSNTPDWILADYLLGCLELYDRTVQARARWYGRMDEPGRSAFNDSAAPPRARYRISIESSFGQDMPHDLTAAEIGSKLLYRATALLIGVQIGAVQVNRKTLVFYTRARPSEAQLEALEALAADAVMEATGQVAEPATRVTIDELAPASEIQVTPRAAASDLNRRGEDEAVWLRDIYDRAHLKPELLSNTTGQKWAIVPLEHVRATVPLEGGMQDTARVRAHRIAFAARFGSLEHEQLEPLSDSELEQVCDDLAIMRGLGPTKFLPNADREAAGARFERRFKQGAPIGVSGSAWEETRAAAVFETYARRHLGELGVCDPPRVLLRAQLALEHAKNARDLAVRLGVDASVFDAAEETAQKLRNELIAKQPITAVYPDIAGVLASMARDAARELGVAVADPVKVAVFSPNSVGSDLVAHLLPNRSCGAEGSDFDTAVVVGVAGNGKTHLFPRPILIGAGAATKSAPPGAIDWREFAKALRAAGLQTGDTL